MMTEIAKKLKELGIELTQEDAWKLTEVIIATMEKISEEM